MRTRPGTERFREFMASLGVADPDATGPVDRLRRAIATPWQERERQTAVCFTHESAPAAGHIFSVITSDGLCLDAVRLIDHDAAICHWRRQYRRALWMGAASWFTWMALVGAGLALWS